MITSWSPSATTARMKKCDSSLEDFMDTFKPENVQERDTKDGLNYIAGQLLDYSKPRGKDNVIDRCAVVLDCDDATPDSVKALCEGVRGLGVRSVVHSTYSSTPDKPKIRVVIPLKDVVAPGDYVALCNAIMTKLNMVTWDESCAQAERIMYAPAKPKNGEYWAKETEGPLMDAKQWLQKTTRKTRTSKGNVAKRDKRRKPKKDPGIQGAFNRVYTIADAIEEFNLPYETCRDGRWTYYGAHAQGGLRLVEDREDLCISEHANTDPACFIDGNGSHRALSAFELCAIHLYGDDDDTSLPPRDRASMQAMAKRAAEDETVRAEVGTTPVSEKPAAEVAWLCGNVDDVDLQAQRAAKALQDKLLYCEGLGWLVYNEKRGIWERSNESAALACVAPVVQMWYHGSLLSGDDKFIKKVSKLRTAGSLRGLLTHIEAFVTVPINIFNADLDLLCAPNGVVDLRAGELRPHSPRYHMTLQTTAKYKPGAKHKAWDKALEAIGIPERKWVQWWSGCALTGYQPDDHGAAVPILTGGGSNGKSVIMTSLVNAFGEYAHVGSQSLLMPDDAKDFLRSCAFLMGVRLCVIEEAPDRMIHGNALKRVASTPTMKGEFKFKSEFTFKATHSLMVSTNNRLRVDEGTDAVARRLTILPFEYKYVENPDPKNPNERPKDAGLLRELETPEAQAAILAWAVEGAKAYFAAGQHVLPATEKMSGLKDELMASGESLAVFFNEMLVEDPEGMIPWTHLYAAFKDGQRDNGGAHWNRMTFKNAVLSHRLFSGFKSGLLRTTGMSLYRDEYGGGPKAPTGGRAHGMRGLRFRTEADGFAVCAGEYVEPEVVVAEPEVVVVEPAPEGEQEELIPVEDIPAPTPHTTPEREEKERRELVEEIEGLVAFVHTRPGGIEEVNRLVAETNCTGPGAPLGKLRAFKIRLEGALVGLSVLQQE